MGVAGRDLGPVGVATHLHRRRAVGRGAITQLTEEVVAPGPQGAVGLDRHRVGVAGRDLSPVSVGPHLHRRGPVGRGAITQAAVEAVAPGPQGAVGLDRHRVVAAGRNLGPVGVRGHLLRGRSVGRGAVTQLTGGVEAPRVDSGGGRAPVLVRGDDPADDRLVAATGLQDANPVGLPGRVKAPTEQVLVVPVDHRAQPLGRQQEPHRDLTTRRATGQLPRPERHLARRWGAPQHVGIQLRHPPGRGRPRPGVVLIRGDEPRLHLRDRPPGAHLTQPESQPCRVRTPTQIVLVGVGDQPRPVLRAVGDRVRHRHPRGPVGERRRPIRQTTRVRCPVEQVGVHVLDVPLHRIHHPGRDASLRQGPRNQRLSTSHRRDPRDQHRTQGQPHKPAADQTKETTRPVHRDPSSVAWDTPSRHRRPRALASQPPQRPASRQVQPHGPARTRAGHASGRRQVPPL